MTASLALAPACGPTAAEKAHATATGDGAEGKAGDRQAAGKGKAKAKAGRGRRGRSSWGGRKHGGGGGDKKDEAVTVEMSRPSSATISRYYEMSGTLSALRSAQLRPVQPGIIVKLFAEEGDTVKEGQLLARLDGRERSLMAARDELNRRNAERELDRLESIASSQALSREELDKQRFAMESALADTKLSRYQAKLNLVRAPFSGVITSRSLDVGNLGTSGDVLYEIADVSALELELHVPEREASKVSVGAKGRVELLDGTEFEATVLRRAPVVDPLTGTVKLTLQTKNYPPAAVPGAFVRAKILLEARENVPSLPRTAVFELDGRPHVYAVVDGKAQRMPVELGLQGEERVEIVSGVDAEQVVVIDGAMDITDGMRLKAAGQPQGRAGKAKDMQSAAAATVTGGEASASSGS